MIFLHIKGQPSFPDHAFIARHQCMCDTLVSPFNEVDLYSKFSNCNVKRIMRRATSMMTSSSGVSAATMPSGYKSAVPLHCSGSCKVSCKPKSPFLLDQHVPPRFCVLSKFEMSSGEVKFQISQNSANPLNMRIPCIEIPTRICLFLMFTQNIKSSPYFYAN